MKNGLVGDRQWTPYWDIQWFHKLLWSAKSIDSIMQLNAHQANDQMVQMSCTYFGSNELHKTILYM